MRAQLHRTAAIAATALTAALAGCGGGGADQPAYCQARDDLTASITELKDVDVRGQGLSALQTQWTEVQTDARALADAARADFGDEARALETSVSTLGTTVEQAAAAPSAQTVTTLAAGISQVTSSFEELSQAVSSKCD